jgi:NDP-sugar pyrophosphorylase family protein
MIGVIVVPGPSSRMHGLDRLRSLALLPVCDRPMLQHIVESLVGHGVTSIELIVGHVPEQVEALLGNGDRWGCRFRYHLEGDPTLPYRSLQVIAETETQPWVLVHAEQYPYFEFPRGPVSQPIFYYGSAEHRARDGQPLSSTNGSHSDVSEWRGAAVFPAGGFAKRIAGQTSAQLRAYLQQLVSAGEASVALAEQWLDASTPAALLDSQTMLLDRRLSGFMISGTERRPGIWISRNVVIHPTVELVGPLYIGPNSRLNRGVRLGANTVIGSECIVDTNTTIENSLVTAGSYIGEGLELNKAVVSQNLLVNVRLDTSVEVVESFLLGGLKPRRPRNWFGRILQAVLALLLAILFLPVSLLSLAYFLLVRRTGYSTVERVQLPAEENELRARSYALPCLGRGAWSVPRRAGWGAFLCQFLPGLWAVVGTRISLVGLPPRSAQEIQDLSPEWRFVYLQTKAGLITEASIASTDPEDETQLYVADAYYAIRRSLLYDLKLALRYFSRLIVPFRKDAR